MSTSSHYYLRLVVAVGVFWLIARLPGAAQFGQGPINNLDLIQIYVDGNSQRNKQAEQERIKANQALVDSGGRVAHPLISSGATTSVGAPPLRSVQGRVLRTLARDRFKQPSGTKSFPNLR